MIKEGVHYAVQQDHNIKLVLSTMASYLTKVESRFLGCDSYLAPEKQSNIISYYKLSNCKITIGLKENIYHHAQNYEHYKKLSLKQSFYSGPEICSLL